MDDRSVAQSGGKERYRAIFDAVPVNIRKMIGAYPKEMDDIEEFRLKAGAPFIVYGRNQRFCNRDGKTTLDRAKAIRLPGGYRKGVAAYVRLFGVFDNGRT